jgi:hypothetical protein
MIQMGLLFLGGFVLMGVAYIAMTQFQPATNPFEGMMSVDTTPNTGSGQGAQNTSVTGQAFFTGTGVGGSASLPSGFAGGGVSPSTAPPIGTATGSLGGWY